MRTAALMLILLTPAHAAVGSAAQESFDKANALYESSRFEGAAVRYKELLRDRPNDPTLHFNLGNAYFRLGQPGSLGLAIASYFRAFRADPRDPDIRHNLEFALQRAGERLVPSGSPRALFIAYHFLSAAELAALHWLFLWGACILLSAAVLKASWRPALTPWIAGAVVLWSVFGSWWGLRWMTSLRSPAVVIVQDAEIRSGPGTNFPVSFKAPEGRRVSRLDAEGSWIEIGIPIEGLKGWVASESIEGL